MTDDFARTRRGLLTAIATTSIVGLAGCVSTLPGTNDQQKTTVDYTLEPPSKQVEVKMGPKGTNTYDPEIVHLEVGGTVTWTNARGSHSATAYHPDSDYQLRIPEDAESWDTGVLVKSGASKSHTFETPGVYDYYCTPHEPFGMIGTVVVGDPDPENQPGLQPPEDGESGKAAAQIERLNRQVRSGLQE